jgi:hypothetical protein
MEMGMEGVESREIASENGEADTMAVDTPAEEDTSSFPNGVVDDGGDSEEPIIRIEGSPTHMRSPSPSRSPPPEKDTRPYMPNGTDPLKAKARLVDNPMMPTVIPKKALGVKDSQPELPPPLNGTAEKRVTDPNPTPSAVERGSEHVGQTTSEYCGAGRTIRRSKRIPRTDSRLKTVILNASFATASLKGGT